MAVSKAIHVATTLAIASVGPEEPKTIAFTLGSSRGIGSALAHLREFGNAARMRLFVGVTDNDWFELLAAQPRLEDVNFWQPGGNRQFKALDPGEAFSL